MEHGVDLNKEGNKDWILLFYACQKEQESIVKYLVDKNKEKIQILYNKNPKHGVEMDIIDEICNENKLKSECLRIIIGICVLF